RDRAAAAFDLYIGALDALCERNRVRGEGYAVEITGAAKSVLTDTSIASLAGLIFGLAIALVISSSIVRPIAALTEHVRRVGQGDLQSRCQYEGRDELGELAQALNRTTVEVGELRRNDGERAATDRSEREGMQARVDELLAVVRRVADGDLTQ